MHWSVCHFMDVLSKCCRGTLENAKKAGVWCLRLPEVDERTRVASNVVVAPPRPKVSDPEKDAEKQESLPEAPTSPLPRARNAEDKSSPLTKTRDERGLKPGQTDADLLNALRIKHRQKELAGRKSYLKNFWYAVGKPPFKTCS